MMEYLEVRWIHSRPDSPVLLYSELDEDRFEVRKVEVYADGTAGFADLARATGSTQLSIEPLPEAEKIARDPQFVPRVIDRVEFDKMWQRHAQ